MKLFTFWRSLTAFRVRMTLAMKGLAWEPITIDLICGDQLTTAFGEINAMAAVPVLVLDDGTRLVQSLAIMEYLDEEYPEPALMPKDALGRARVRALAQMTAADSHPMIAPRMGAYLASAFGASPQQVDDWSLHWMSKGLDAYERRLARDRETGVFCHGDSITIADLCLVSHWVGVTYFGGDLEGHPTVKRIVERCMQDRRIADAHPLRQPGAPKRI